jgi:hypothetical protein
MNNTKHTPETGSEAATWFYEQEVRKNEKLKTINSELLEALKECEEYFDNKADADYAEWHIANEEMKLLIVIRNAIQKVNQ